MQEILVTLFYKRETLYFMDKKEILILVLAAIADIVLIVNVIHHW
jgi:hypothetical protein